MKRLKEEEDYDEDESIDAAVNERKFLLQRMLTYAYTNVNVRMLTYGYGSRITIVYRIFGNEVPNKHGQPCICS